MLYLPENGTVKHTDIESGFLQMRKDSPLRSLRQLPESPSRNLYIPIVMGKYIIFMKLNRHWTALFLESLSLC